MIATLCGGVGAARFLEGLLQVVAPEEIVAIVNTGDDLTVCGLPVSPDLDTITYTLGGVGNKQSGWGREGESWRTIDELERLGGPSWFRLGDLDIATHLYRRHRLNQGATLATVTDEIRRHFAVPITMLPMTNDSVSTMITLGESTPEFDEGSEVSFQDYFVRLRHSVKVRSVRFTGVTGATCAPGVLEALASAEKIVIAPSNPVVSIGPILSLAPIADHLAQNRDRVVAISPLIGGRAIKGPADRLLEELGPTKGIAGICARYRAFSRYLVLDEKDADQAQTVEQHTMVPLITNTLMSDPLVSAQLAKVVLNAF